jgi:DNA ligase-1
MEKSAYSATKPFKPFQELQKRMGVKKPSKELIGKYPVVFIGYDLLYLDQKETVSQSLIQRRISLQKLAKKYEFPISKQHSVDSKNQVEQLFEQALAHGNEGTNAQREKCPLFVR